MPAGRLGAQLGEQVGDPASLRDEAQRQVVGQWGGEPLEIATVIETLLEVLQEVRPALRRDREHGRDRLPPGRDGDVEARASGVVVADDTHVGGRRLAVGRRHRHGHGHAVVAREQPRVVQHGPNAPRRSEAGEHEAHPLAHARASIGA